MVFFYLTNIVLDVTAGASWWVIRKTSYGIYSAIHYMLYGSANSETPEEIKMIEYKTLTNEINSLKKEIISLKEQKL